MTETDFLADAYGFVGVFQRFGSARNHRYPAAIMRCRAAILSPMASIVSAVGPMKMMPAASQRRTNPHSRTESRSRDGRRRLCIYGHVDDTVDVQITFVRLGRADAVSFVGIHHVP